MTTRITLEKAEKIGRAHGCVRCGERNYEWVRVTPANLAAAEEFNEAWHVMLRCGVCAAESELGLDLEGNVLYAH